MRSCYTTFQSHIFNATIEDPIQVGPNEALCEPKEDNKKKSQ